MQVVPPGSHGIVYARVSTQHQSEDELPIASQVAELTAAVLQAGATCEVITDEGISGTDLAGRTGLQQIASRARDPHPDFTWVLVWKLSRFARNMEEGLVYRALLRKRGIELISHKEPVPEGPIGMLITHILMAVDEFYAAATAADVLRSQKELARQGYSPGGRPPVGYQRAVDTIGTRYGGAPLTRVRWVPDPNAAPRVVRAFAMAAAGETYDTIVAETSVCRNKSSLATILANPIYRGLRVFNKERRVEGEHGRKRTRNTKDAQVTSAVEPLVDERTWATVAARLTRTRENRLPSQRYENEYLLSDVLHCQCSSRMFGSRNQTARYYRCRAKCGKSIRADVAEDAILSAIRDVLLTPESVREMLESANATLRAEQAQRRPAAAAAKADIRRLEREEAHIRTATRSAPASAMPSLLEELGAVGDELRAARDRLSATEVREKMVAVTEAHVSEALQEMRTIMAEAAPFAERARWIAEMIERVDLEDGHSVVTWARVDNTNGAGGWLRR